MLSVHGLVVRLGGLSILRSLSLEIPTGSILGLVGRNGAGKTTTLRSIMGLVPVESGHVVLDNRDIVRLRSEEHTSELQSQSNLVCRLLLEKKKKKAGRQVEPQIRRTEDATSLTVPE